MLLKNMLIATTTLMLASAAQATVVETDPCQSADQTFATAADCKAYDGDPGGVGGLRICHGIAQQTLLLITSENGVLTRVSQTDHQKTDTTYTLVAGKFSLSLPAKPVADLPFEAVFMVPTLGGPTVMIPLVCTITK